MTKSIGSYPRVRVEGGGSGVVSQAGAVLLVETARKSGLDTAISAALAPLRKPRTVHDPGKVLIEGPGSRSRRAGGATCAHSASACVRSDNTRHVALGRSPSTTMAATCAPISSAPRPLADGSRVSRRLAERAPNSV